MRPPGLPPGFPSQHVLFHNNGDGTFTNVSEKASGYRDRRKGYGMTVVAADFDEDGWQDIYVACDSTPSRLYMNNRDGTFREEGILRGVALNDDGAQQSGMGVGIGDFSLSGHLDLLKTHFVEDMCELFENDGKANFTMPRYRAGSALRRVTHAGARESSTLTTTDIPISSLSPEAYIRRWNRSFLVTLINARVFFFGTWGTAHSRNWARRPVRLSWSGTQAGAALSETLIMMVISTS